jgi:hypothetical protein
LVSVSPAAAAFSRAPDGAAVVSYTVVNPGAEPVRLTGSCGDDPAPTVERLTSGSWHQYAGGTCLAIYPVGAVVLAPTASRQASVSLAEPGEYRLVLATDRGQVTSVAFTVR